MTTDYERLRALVADEPLPTALVDLDALDRNIDRLRDTMGARPLPVRVASKSIRVPWLVRYVLRRLGPVAGGVMCYTAHEAAFLAAEGFTDLVLAYPASRPAEADALAQLVEKGVSVLAMVDEVAHLDLLSAAATRRGVTIGLCVDVDVSLRPLGTVHLGVRRSPLRTGDAAAALGRAARERPGLEVRAVMAYEAQVAGLRDVDPARRWMSPVVRWIKRRSVPLAERLRHEVVAALRADGHPVSVVNGGGTGSLATTSADPTVTEVTAGSGFLCPHLFDGYDNLELEPAALFAISVTRVPGPGLVTCAGGGFAASGSPGPDRLPVAHLPRGLEPLGMEGWGEVQTPFRVPPGVTLAVGDPVFARHAKAGELAERFGTYLLVRGGRIEERVPTYRGMGRSFG